MNDPIVIFLAGLLLGGTIVGLLTLWTFAAYRARVRQIVDDGFAAFCAAMNRYGEQLAANNELRRINHQLGHAMQEAGLEVKVIGECTCEAEDEEIEQVWLPEQEASRQ